MKAAEFLLLLFSLPVFGFAQDSTDVAVGDRNILYRKEASGGIFLHSSGFGISFKSGRQISVNRKRILEFDFVSIKHAKENKVTNPNLIENSKPFVFGKLNYVYVLRSGIGLQNILFTKAERGGVEVRYNYYGGLSLGFTKPVYLDVIVDSSTSDRFIVFDTKPYDPTDPYQQDITDFVGRGPFFSGFDKIKIYPGVHIKTSLSFEYSGWQRKIAALEAGITTVSYTHLTLPTILRV